MRLAVTIDEAGQMIGVGKTKAYEMAKSGELPIVLIGGLKRVPVALLQAIAEGRTLPPSAKEEK